ncbi:MAG TPA: DUF3325 family protein [Paucimonas sp.]|nr:DUF3325 family protein [Paucimonas sp.]
MKPLLLAAASAFAALAGMAALCFQSPSQRHRMGLPEQARGRRCWFAAAGAAMLAISLIAAIAADGPSFGIVLWLCQAGIIGLFMILLLPYAIAWVIRVSGVAAILGWLLFVGGKGL